MSDFSIALRAASRSFGIQTSYKNNEGRDIFAPNNTLAQLCKELAGIFPLNKNDALNILKKKFEILIQKKIPTSIVAWGEKLNTFHVQLHPNTDLKNIKFYLNDEILEYSILNTLNRKSRTTLRIQINAKIPIGYHDLILYINDEKSASSFIISAPEKLNTKEGHSWGPFIPIYALRSDSDWGIGSFSDLATAAEICKKNGADFISILPTLAGNFDTEDCDPSPYSALTRFFWNEIFLDVDSLLLKYPIPEALKLRNSTNFKSQLTELRSTLYVNYYKCYELKKNILLILSRHFFHNPLPESFSVFLNENPLAKRYADFRAKKNQNNKIQESQYHLFVQYETHLALLQLHQNLGLDLYMDYPVGVNDSGFDFFEDPTNFLGSVSVGAPPEPVFQLGQDWGFPAFHPEKLPLKKYSYFIESIRQHLKFSKILRLDHIIGLYRIYSVPKGFGGKNGAYIRFSAEDFFAIVVLEADNFGADIIGENLGTVPDKVNEILAKRNLKGMLILQLELGKNPESISANLDQKTLCALNTHDMPMFSSFLKTDDLTQVRDLGILGAEFYSSFQEERKYQIKRWAEVLQPNPTLGALKFLSQSNCRYLVVNLEDLWNEELPQNIPGTWKEVPNWRRKMALPIDQWENHINCKLALNLLKENFS